MRGLMSPSEAEHYLGLRPSFKGRALLRRALAKERQTGRRFVIREGGPRRVRYKLTAELIRRHLPELWEGAFERMSRTMRQTADSIERNIDERIDGRIERHPKVQLLDERTIETMGHVRRLQTQVQKISDRTPKDP